MKCTVNILKNKVFLRSIGILLMGAMIPFLAGCAQKAPAPQWTANGKSSLQVRQHNFQVLRHQGVQVIQLGETVRLIIPSHCLFKSDLATLQSYDHNVLNNVANVLNTYHIVSVKVAAFSNRAGSYNSSLMNRQAKTVQSYLSDRGITARLIYGVGQGNKNPVAWNGTAAGRAVNRRVEISFMYYRA